MLVHADRDDLVESLALRHVAVILTTDLGLLAQSLFGDAPARLFDLSLAQRNADRLDAVMFGGPAHKPAPAAADVEQSVARFQSQFPAEMIELLFLRRVEIFRAGFEIRAGIDHMAVEPEPVELVRDIVVVTHIGGILPPGVPPQSPDQRPDMAQHRRMPDPLGERDPDLEDVLDLAFDRELARDIS